MSPGLNDGGSLLIVYRLGKLDVTEVLDVGPTLYIKYTLYMYTCVNIHIYIRTYIHVYIHTYMHTYIHVYIHTYIHT